MYSQFMMHGQKNIKLKIDVLRDLAPRSLINKRTNFSPKLSYHPEDSFSLKI